MVGWVSPGPRRTTWSIIWSCLSIFIVCSWKCVHLNIPSHEEIQGEWDTFNICKSLQDIPYWPKAPLLRKWRRKIIWMVFVAVAPEFGVGLAMRQYMEARAELKSVRKMKTGNRVQNFTMAHAFYVQMGGIVVYDLLPQQYANQTGSDINREISNDEPESTSFMLQDLEINRYSNIPEHGGDAACSNGATVIPRGRLITSLAEIDEYSVVPKIIEYEIRDLSKADAITKAFAIIQCTWMALASIVRGAQGYSISQLELVTFGFIFCALVMHVFWWYKPFDVETRRVLARLPPSGITLPNPSFLSMDDLTRFDPQLSKKKVDDLPDDILINLIEITKLDWDSMKQVLPSAAIYLTATGFSAIHLVAWDWVFPSFTARMLWRGFNLGALVASILPPMLLMAKQAFHTQSFKTVIRALYFAACVSYIISRIVVLCLTFYCLSWMPEQAYISVSWLGWIPHFS